MLLESALAVIVILACCAGVGMGHFERVDAPGTPSGYTYEHTQVDGHPLTGKEAWHTRYDSSKSWASFGLGQTVGAFVEGGANFIAAIGIPLKYAMAVVAVLVACFAATTLDTATRLQRYVIQELAGTFRIAPLKNRYAATLLAVACGGAMALLPGPSGKPGTGGLILWPLFGAVNQLLAGLAFMVTAFYLWRRSKPVWFVVAPMILLLIMPVWAMFWQIFNSTEGWYWKVLELNTQDLLWRQNCVLFVIGVAVIALQIWMIIEGLLIWRKAKGVLEETLPLLTAKPDMAGGRSC
jgi:carbon starvation protein